MRKMRLSVSLSLATLLVFNSISLAQSAYGNLRGSVVDQAGATISNAKVTLIEEATGVTRSAVSTSSGEYTFANINPNTYTVIVEQAGFKKVPPPALSTRFGGNGTVVFFGLAKPVHTPLIGPPQQP